MKRYSKEEEKIIKKFWQTEQLYKVAYEMKFLNLKREHPKWSDKKCHNETVRLIDKGTKW